jgi:hypothetical protein
MTDITGAISDLAIPEKAAIQEAYRQRAAGQFGRIERAVTRATGVPPNFNVVDYEQFLTEARAAAADPLYAQWRSMQVHPTRELQALIPRLEDVGAFDEAEFLSKASGVPMNRSFFVGGPQKEFPTTQTWDLVKQGLDSKIEQAIAVPNMKRARALLQLKGELVSEIEKTNAGQVWRQARQEFADRSALIDQLAAGRDTFLGGRSGLTPDELNEELRHLSRPEIVARIQGMRAAVRDAMGDRTEGAGAMRGKLLQPNNQAKMRMLLGRVGRGAEADELIQTLEQEHFLAGKFPQVVPNPQTGASNITRQERRNLFNPPQVPQEWNLLSPGTWPLVGQFEPRHMLQGIINDRYARVAPQLARTMLTPQPQIPDLLQALIAERARTATAAQGTRRWVSTPLGALISGPGQAAYTRKVEAGRQAPLPPP